MRIALLSLTCLGVLGGPLAAQTVIRQISGDDPFAGFGQSLGAARDVNGDGVPDLVVGTTSFVSGELGAMHVYSGADGSVLLSVPGDFGFGYAVNGAGDVNGDGFADLLVGVPYWDPTLKGYLRVYSGKDAAVLYEFYGDTTYDKFGNSVAGVGDLDGDGFDDFAAGTGSAYPPAPGYARVFSGRTGSVLFDFKGDSNNDQFGYSLASAGDVNGDGSLDIIVGAIGDDPHGRNSGSARVLSGRDGQILYTFDGPASAAAFGWSVSGAGDVNADGFADVIASSFSQSKPDYAEVYSGADGVLLHHFDEFYGGANTVAGIGDVDEDGFADVMVGPSVADSADVYSGRDGSLLFRPGGEDREGFGWAVTGVGDVTGDGVPEFAVGAPNGNWDQTGYVRLYSGRACTARSSNYGLGWPGTFGIPALSSSAEPRFCAATTIDVSNSRTSTTSAVLFLGLDRASLFTEWDGILLVSPSWVISFVLPDPGISLPAFIPCDGSLCGTVVYAQVLEQDPGASKGVSFTPGLQIVLGY